MRYNKREIEEKIKKIKCIIEENSLNIEDIWEKYYKEKIPYQKYKEIIAIDPTYQGGEKMGRYGKWLIEQYRRGKEIGEKTREIIKKYERLKRIIGNIDIMKYDEEGIREYIEEREKEGIRTSNREKEEKIKEGIIKGYEDNKWLVIIPLTKEASCYYGRGTKWCTSATKSENKFEFYNNQGKLYINIDKQKGKKYQFFFENREFNDEKNEPIMSPIYKNIGMDKGILEWYNRTVKGGLAMLICEYISEKDEEGDSIIVIEGKYNIIRKDGNFIWRRKIGDWFDYIKEEKVEGYYEVYKGGEIYYMDKKGNIYK